MKHLAAIALSALCAISASAAVTQRWTVETSRVQPASFDAVRGESIALEVTLQSYGKAVEIPSNAPVSIYWQTNGMASAWWTASASVVGSNVLAAVFTPEMDVGAKAYNCYIGSAGTSYRAAFQLRFREGPGAVPNELPLPAKTIDFAKVTVTNDPWTARIEALEEGGSSLPAGCMSWEPDNQLVFRSSIDDSGLYFHDTLFGEGIEIYYSAVGWKIRSTAPGFYWIVDGEGRNIGSVLDSKAAQSTTLGGYGIRDAYTKEEADEAAGEIVTEAIDSMMADVDDKIENAKSNVVTFTEDAAFRYVEGKPIDIISNVRVEGSLDIGYELKIPQNVTSDNEHTLSEFGITNSYTKEEADTSFYPSADGEALERQVSAIGAHLNAEDAHFVSTNYDSVTRIPEAYVEIKMNGSWLTIWREMTRWNKWTGPDFDWTGWSGFGNWKTNIESEVSHKAERNWGMYDSETGGLSPDGYTQISSSNILIAAGMAYQRTVTTDGAVWVLQCNTGTASLGGDTNGFFRIKDADGNTQFEIVKGDKREMGADAAGIEVDNSTSPQTLIIPYSVEAGDHPTIQVCTDLSTADWRAEDDAACPALVSWSGSSGAWVARVARKAPGNQLFARATFMAGGETYIRNVAPVSMDSIMLNGTKYYLGTATIDGHTVLTLSTTKPAN